MPERPTKDLESLLLPTLKARDHQAEGYEAGLRRATPQVGTIVKGIVDGDSRVIELFRSPTASQGEGGALGEAVARERGNTVGIRDQAMDLARLQGYKVSREVANLPTPTVSDQYTGNLSSTQQTPGSLHSVTLAQIFHKPDLFPTPKALDGVKGNLKTSQERLDSGHQVDLPNIAIDLLEPNETKWGKFEPAIRRWEALTGRSAPAPTKPDGKEGNHRLSSKFTEWMMGLPDNWITGHDLKRNDELKLAGNGVVPQQAELALRLLLEER